MLHITPWERSALQLLATVSNRREIARRLDLTEQEIQRRLDTLFARMGATTPADAVAAAFRRGLLPVEHRSGRVLVEANEPAAGRDLDGFGPAGHA